MCELLARSVFESLLVLGRLYSHNCLSVSLKVHLHILQPSYWVVCDSNSCLSGADCLAYLLASLADSTSKDQMQNCAAAAAVTFMLNNS